jgi:hypothetical protein
MNLVENLLMKKKKKKHEIQNNKKCEHTISPQQLFEQWLSHRLADKHKVAVERL